MADADDLVIVFFGSFYNANVAKNLLESFEIKSVLLDEHIGTMAPSYAAAGGVGAVKVAVRQADLEESQTVLAAISSKDSAEPQGAPWTCSACGEESEAQFGECWSCQKPRPETSP